MSYEDLTTFTEVDSEGHYTQTTFKSTGTNLNNNSTGYVYKDYGVGHFTDFEHLIDTNHVSSTYSSSGGCVAGIYCVTNNPTEHENCTNGLGLFHYKSIIAPNNQYLYIKDYNNSNQDSYTNVSMGTTYYLTIERDDTTGTCKIYSDSDRTTLLDTLSITCETTTYRYLMCGFARGRSVNYNHNMEVYAENFDLQETPVTGYLLTSSTTTVNLNDPTTITITTTKKVQNYVFADGTDAQLDIGKAGDGIIISGVEWSSAFDKMKWLNTIMDNQETVTLSNLSDTNLNTDYYVRDLEYKQQIGNANIYRYSITLERLYDSI